MNTTMRDAVTETAIADPHGYLAYYKLSDAPFRATADPRRLWLGAPQRALLDTLAAAIGRGDGVLLLTGDVGTGKTSVVNWLVETLGGESLLVGRLPPGVFEVSELSQAVADAFGFDGQFPSAAALATRFRDFLADAQSRGTNVLLVIDEAQGLGDELLRKVFDLATIGTFEERPFAILLAGQKELSETLSADQHAGLRQRITTQCVLEPLTMEEVGEYIGFRLRTVGSEEPIFTSDAVRQIASASCGAPGLINVICEHALLEGYRRQAREVGAEIVEACLGGLGLGDDGRWLSEGPVRPLREPPEGPMSPRRRSARLGATVTIALLSLAIVGAGGYGLYAARFGRPSSRPVQVPTATPEIERPGQRDGASSPAAVAGDAAEASADEDNRPRLPPRNEGPKPPPARASREPVRSAPVGAQAPVSGGRARRQDPPPRDRADVPAPERGTDPNDPGAIIDWLMRKSGQ